MVPRLVGHPGQGLARRGFGGALEIAIAILFAGGQLVVVGREAAIQPHPSTQHDIADEGRGFVPRLGETLSQGGQTFEPRIAIARTHRMLAHIAGSHDGSMGGGRQRRRRDGVLEENAASRQSIDGWRDLQREAISVDIVRPERVDRNQQNIGARGLGLGSASELQETKAERGENGEPGYFHSAYPSASRRARSSALGSTSSMSARVWA